MRVLRTALRVVLDGTDLLPPAAPACGLEASRYAVGYNLACELQTTYYLQIQTSTAATPAHRAESCDYIAASYK